MRGYSAFVSKELKENMRNYKFFILGIVFAIVGLLSPLSAKFLPELLENVMDENITIIVGEPTYVDSWLQFYSNISQIALVAFVLVFSSVMSKEYEKGTLVHMVTKGLPRLTIYGAKLSVLALSWTVLYWFSFLITLGYTAFYFPNGTTEGLLLSAGSFYLFGLLLISLLMVSGVLFKSTFAPLLVVGGSVALLFMGNIFPVIERWSPLQLSTRNIEVLMTLSSDAAFDRGLIITVLLIVVFSIVGGIVFKRKALQ
ncbi:ABC transporter permease subunit [Alkalibacterium olivapovliticus]|uniref:ABC-2 type transport system permease protein n=1 Tax=Alkalibacterium olivapovliticus TaxID=99907 RepID=A0A2T0WAT0_9LACT|nr:ABC transporter permease subunit [Alkalibacterium olivapovliticus]PRY83634.1 ABC-2 type transport system permease protein [Alkalibacterium olivapovliticus]